MTSPLSSSTAALDARAEHAVFGTLHGRHKELTALRSTYFELFTLQARAYADDPDTVPA